MDQFKLIQIPARTLSVPVITDNQTDISNSKAPPQLRKFLFKKGVSGNPAGRPKGKSMKEYSREYLEAMSEEERVDFMNEIDKTLIWKMAEGNPHQGNTVGVDVNKESLASITELLKGMSHPK